MGEINTNMFKEKCVNLIEVLKSALFIISGLYTVKTCVVTVLEVTLEIQMVKNLFLTLCLTGHKLNIFFLLFLTCAKCGLGSYLEYPTKRNRLNRVARNCFIFV
jgi:hypothetical protein